MTDDDLQQRLDALGRRDTPMVDPTFADGLESDLRAMAAAPARPSLLAVLLRPSVVVVALAVLAGVAFFLSRPDDAGLEFAAAEGTSVSIPGSPELSAGVVGQSIPDGTRITVGPEGSATVGGVILDPGTVAIVVNGVVEVIELPPTRGPDAPDTTVAPTEDSPAPTTSTASTTTAPTTEGPTTLAPTDREPTATDATTEATASTAAAPTTTEADGAPTTSTSSPPSTTESSTTTSAPTTTTVPAREPIAPTITLSINVGENGRALLEWAVDGDTDEIAGWVVRRGRGDDAMPAAVIRRPEARRQRVDLPDRNVAWMVVARNTDGEVIARSNLVRAN